MAKQMNSQSLPSLWMLVALGVLFLSAQPMRAQVAGGTILGTVTDPGGAVIPNAQVTMKDSATGRVSHREHKLVWFLHSNQPAA